MVLISCFIETSLVEPFGNIDAFVDNACLKCFEMRLVHVGVITRWGDSPNRGIQT